MKLPFKRMWNKMQRQYLTQYLPSVSLKKIKHGIRSMEVSRERKEDEKQRRID